MLHLVSEQLDRAQKRVKKYADRNRSERSCQVGEPFKIVEKIGNLAYKLELLEDIRVHPAFHVSQLKPFTPNYSPVFSELPSTADLTAVDALPVAILDRRMMKQGSGAVVQIQVQWDNPAATTTWEDYTVLRWRYPTTSIWIAADSEVGVHSEERESVTTATPDTAVSCVTG